MEGWIKYSFGEIIEDISDGGTPSRSKEGYFGGTIPWVVIDDIQDYIYDTTEKLTEAGLKACSSKLWPKGTIILSTGATIGEVGIAQVAVATKQGICGIRINESKIDNVFFMYYLKYIKSQLLSLAQGSTIKEIRPSVICSFSLYAPKSIEEQRTIGNLLTKVDASIMQTQQLIEKLSKIKIGVMQDLLTKGIDERGNIRSEETHEFEDKEIGRFPKEWKIDTLKNLAEISSGVTLGAKYDNSTDLVELPYLRVANVQDGYLDLKEITTIQIPRSQIERYKLQIGDVLMNEGGDFDKLGRGTVWRGEIKNCLHQNHVFKVRCNKEKLLPEYLELVSASAYGKRFFILSSKQSTNLASINKTQLSSFLIPLPNLEEQKRISNIIEKFTLEIELEKKQKVKLQKLKSGLMQDLLSGNVSITDLIPEEVVNQ